MIVKKSDIVELLSVIVVNTAPSNAKNIVVELEHVRLNIFSCPSTSVLVSRDHLAGHTSDGRLPQVDDPHVHNDTAGIAQPVVLQLVQTIVPRMNSFSVALKEAFTRSFDL